MRGHFTNGWRVMDYIVASVDEALGLLELVAHSPGFGVTELSKRSGITKARAFRLLSTLEVRGFVQRTAEAATYHLGNKALLLGLAATDQVSLVRQSSKYLAALGAKFNENVQIRVRDGFESVGVARWDSTHDLRIHGTVGGKRPLHVGASGKLLLAHAPDDFVQTFLAQDLQRFTANTIVHKTRMTQELARIRKQGYATSVGELATDVLSVAAPVRDGAGQVIAALGISVPSTRAQPQDLEGFATALRVSAEALSAELGYRAP